MNILYLCDEYPPGRHGGIGTVVQMLARKMVQLGHKVVVAGFYDPGYGQDDHFSDQGVEVFRFRQPLSSSWFAHTDSLRVRLSYRALKLSGLLQWNVRSGLKKYGAFLEGIIQKNKIDIIEAPDYNDYLRLCSTYIPFPKLPAPKVIKLHGTMTYFAREAGKDIPKYVWQAEHDLLKNASAVCSVSRYTAERTAAYLNYTRPIVTLYNGIEVGTISSFTAEKTNTVVFTGTLVEKKGIFQLMKAWNIVHDKNKNVQLIVAGKGAVEKARSLLSDSAAATVTFTGHVPRTDVARLLQEAKVAVFPSYAECFALGPMEAMANGTAVVYSKRHSGSELINDEKDGFLIEPDNVNEIAEAILRLLGDSSMRNGIAANGMEKVKINFDLDVIARKHIDFYKEVLKD
jgi:glycogen synthase